MPRRNSMLLVACMLAFGATPLLAQGRPQTREGFNISFGLGGGSAGLKCDLCGDIDRETGTTFFLNIGGTVTPQLTVGGELNGWGKTSDSEEDLIGSAMAVVHYYPVVTQGFFVSGGAGFTSLSVTDKSTDDEITSDAFGVQIGAGYDWRVARNFSLSPYVQYVHGFGGEAKFNGDSTGADLNPNFFQIGLGFSWH